MAEDVSDGPNTILKVASVFLIGVIFLSGLNTGLGSQFIQADSTRLTLNDQPADGDTVTISGYVFEFDSGDGVTAGHVQVTIGDTITDTVSNFAAAVGGV